LGQLSVKADALRGLKKRFDGGRFVGTGGDAGRDWMQIRRGFEDRTKFPWENEPEGCREVFFKVFTIAEDLARDCLTAILRQIDHPAKGEQLDFDGGSSSFGSSVMRIFRYKDAPPSARPGAAASGVHADMGLVTVAPVSTIPALQLLDPRTGRTHHPEKDLPPSSWIVFAGETLGFLTGGKIGAPLHMVPYVDRSGGAHRYSAPFFLRAGPETVLVPTDSSRAMTCRSLMQRHSVGLRPWRLPNAGNGDW